MKNIRLLIGMLSSAALWLGLSAAPAMAAAVVAPGTAKLMIESKTITPGEAAALVSSGEKVTLGVYLVLDAGWKTQLEAKNVVLSSNQLSFAFFNDNTYAPDDFLTDPASFINICRRASSFDPAGACTDIATEGGLGEWYPRYIPYYVGTANNQTNVPTYAYGGLFNGSGAINVGYPYCDKKDGIYYIKLFDIQFILKSATRDLPVGILDEYLVKPAGGSAGNTELNIMDENDNPYRPSGMETGLADWTRVPAPHFEFVNGGLFISRAPEVKTLEPSFLGYAPV